MAKFHDKVGFLIPKDNQVTGIAETIAVERRYYGDVLEHERRWNSTEHLNDDLVLSNRISIVANDYAFKHLSAIAYVKLKGCFWKVESVKIEIPRIILSIGGVWHGPTAASGQASHACP